MGSTNSHVQRMTKKPQVAQPCTGMWHIVRMARTPDPSQPATQKQFWTRDWNSGICHSIKEAQKEKLPKAQAVCIVWFSKLKKLSKGERAPGHGHL